jgi:O-antigen ligase
MLKHVAALVAFFALSCPALVALDATSSVLTSVVSATALLFGIAGLALSLLNRPSLEKDYFGPLKYLALIALVYAVSSLVNGHVNPQSAKTIAQLFLTFGFFIFLSREASPVRTLRTIFLAELLLAPLIAAYLAVHLKGSGGEAGSLAEDDPVLGLKNAFGQTSVSYCILAAVLFSSSTKLRDRALAMAVWALSAAIVVLSHSRGALLALILFTVVFGVWPLVDRLRLKRVAVFTFIFILLPCLFWGYLHLEDLSNFSVLQSNVRSTTGLNVYTGRQLIWPLVLDAIAQHPWLGMGADAQAKTLLQSSGIDQEWSCHDLYLQVALQGGVFALGCLALFFVSLWRVISPRGTVMSNERIAVAALLTICFSELFEVTLLQNLLIAGLSDWGVFALVRASSAYRLQPIKRAKPIMSRQMPAWQKIENTAVK